MMDVTQALREMRIRAGYTSMDDFAKAMGYKGFSSIQRYETPGSYSDCLPYNFIRKALPVLTAKGIPESEVLALGGELVRVDAKPEQVTKNLDEIPISRIKIFVIALAEYAQERALRLAPGDQGDIVATVCRWYEEEVATGREPPDISIAEAKRLISVTLSARAK